MTTTNNEPEASGRGEAPSERIWLQRGQAADPAECTLSHVSPDGSGEAEYILRSTHDAEVVRLREALRGLVNHGDNCWCVEAPDPDDVEGHTTYCAAARNALNSAGKE